TTEIEPPGLQPGILIAKKGVGQIGKTQGQQDQPDAGLASPTALQRGPRRLGGQRAGQPRQKRGGKQNNATAHKQKAVPQRLAAEKILPQRRDQQPGQGQGQLVEGTARASGGLWLAAVGCGSVGVERGGALGFVDGRGHSPYYTEVKNKTQTTL